MNELQPFTTYLNQRLPDVVRDVASVDDVMDNVLPQLQAIFLFQVSPFSDHPDSQERRCFKQQIVHLRRLCGGTGQNQCRELPILYSNNYNYLYTKMLLGSKMSNMNY